MPTSLSPNDAIRRFVVLKKIEGHPNGCGLHGS